MSRVTPLFGAIKSTTKGSTGQNIAGRISSFQRASLVWHRGSKDTKTENIGNNDLIDRSGGSEFTSSQTSHSLHTAHRPTVSQNYKTIPMMQGFRNSAPKHAFHGLSTIDSHFMPFLKGTPLPPFKPRVPLLPDNYTPNRSSQTGQALETLDDAIPKPEISIVAYHFDHTTPAPLGEVAETYEFDTRMSSLSENSILKLN